RDGNWAAALAVLQQAQDLLASSGGDNLELGRELARRSHDLKLAGELEEIRVRKSGLDGGRLAFPRAAEEYAKAFHDDDINIEAWKPDEVAERIRGRTIPAELIAALDDWAVSRYGATKGKKNDPLEQRLLAAARAADEDPVRNAVRAALADRDRQAVEALAGNADVERMPPITLVFVAFALG